MNILIFLLSLIDSILIYIFDYFQGNIGVEILTNIFATPIYFIVFNIWYKKNENIIRYLRYFIFFIEVLVFITLLYIFVAKKLYVINSGFETFIPSCLAYYGLQLKIKKD